MKVITLSKTFPTYHSVAGTPTKFREKFLDKKIHTIRQNAKGYFKDGDLVSVREWSGKPYASKQDVIKDGVRIGVEPVEMKLLWSDSGLFFILIKVFGIKIDWLQVVINDGLEVIDFLDWFFPYKNGRRGEFFQGDIIHFTEFRYQQRRASDV